MEYSSLVCIFSSSQVRKHLRRHVQFFSLFILFTLDGDLINFFILSFFPLYSLPEIALLWACFIHVISVTIKKFLPQIRFWGATWNLSWKWLAKFSSVTVSLICNRETRTFQESWAYSRCKLICADYNERNATRYSKEFLLRIWHVWVVEKDEWIHVEISLL